MRLFLRNGFYSLSDHALNQPAMQSSTYTTNYNEAKRAVDGHLYTCSRTNSQQDPWWRVNLGSSLPVAEVKLQPYLFWNFEIRIGKSTA